MPTVSTIYRQSALDRADSFIRWFDFEDVEPTYQQYWTTNSHPLFENLSTEQTCVTTGVSQIEYRLCGTGVAHCKCGEIRSAILWSVAMQYVLIIALVYNCFWYISSCLLILNWNDHHFVFLPLNSTWILFFNKNNRSNWADLSFRMNRLFDRFSRSEMSLSINIDTSRDLSTVTIGFDRVSLEDTLSIHRRLSDQMEKLSIESWSNTSVDVTWQVDCRQPIERRPRIHALVAACDNLVLSHHSFQRDNDNSTIFSFI